MQTLNKLDGLQVFLTKEGWAVFDGKGILLADSARGQAEDIVWLVGQMAEVKFLLDEWQPQLH